MAKGNEIIVSANPRGVFMEGTIRTASSPGIVLQVDISEGLNANGRPQWEPYTGTDGSNTMIAILLPDQLQGKLATEAYVALDQCFVYVPVAGEEFNMLIQDIAGTADDRTFGTIMMVDSSTGTLLATTGVEAEPFQLWEAITDPVADTLAHCVYTGY